MGLIRKKIWKIISGLYPFWLKRVYKVNIGSNVVISYKARLDKSINPKGIYIGDNTWVLADACILAHDYCRGTGRRGKLFDTHIGCNCVLGVSCIVLPGVRIGNHVIIGSGAVVSKDIPDNCIVVGNPARVVKTGIYVSDYGQIINN